MLYQHRLWTIVESQFVHMCTHIYTHIHHTDEACFWSRMNGEQKPGQPGQPGPPVISVLPALFEDVTQHDPESANQPARYVVRLRRVVTVATAPRHDVGVGIVITLDDYGRHVIGQIDPASAAKASGMMHEGDVVVQVEGNSCVGLKPEGVMKLIRYMCMCVCVCICVYMYVCTG